MWLVFSSSLQFITLPAIAIYKMWRIRSPVQALWGFASNQSSVNSLRASIIAPKYWWPGKYTKLDSLLTNNFVKVDSKQQSHNRSNIFIFLYNPSLVDYSVVECIPENNIEFLVVSIGSFLMVISFLHSSKLKMTNALLTSKICFNLSLLKFDLLLCFMKRLEIKILYTLHLCELIRWNHRTF